MRGQHMLPRLENVWRAHKLGVHIVTGGDTGYGPDSMTRIARDRELRGAGFTPLEALRSATIVNAAMLRREKPIGASSPASRRISSWSRRIRSISRTLQDPLLVVSNGRVGLDRLNFAR